MSQSVNKFGGVIGLAKISPVYLVMRNLWEMLLMQFSVEYTEGHTLHILSQITFRFAIFNFNIYILVKIGNISKIKVQLNCK